jgi:FKBP-type peptidyl-prolyl cis-trans isomerase
MGKHSKNHLTLLSIALRSVLSVAAAVPVGASESTAAVGPATAAQPTHPLVTMSQSEQDQALYALGVLISHNLDEFDLSSTDFDQVKAGLIDGFNHRATQVDLVRDGPKVQGLRRERLARLKIKREQAGRAFLDRAAALAGARRSATGLVYIPIREGSGSSPGPNDQVRVNYEGRLIDGTVFDGSREQGGPSTFNLRSVISCWSEALPLMRVGGKGRIVCPAALAYGAQGEQPKVGPDATLDFEVELLDVTPGAGVGSPGGSAAGAP